MMCDETVNQSIVKYTCWVQAYSGLNGVGAVVIECLLVPLKSIWKKQLFQCYISSPGCKTPVSDNFDQNFFCKNDATVSWRIYTQIFLAQLFIFFKVQETRFIFSPCKSPACHIQEYCTKWTHMITSSPGCKTPVSDNFGQNRFIAEIKPGL